MCTDGSDVFAGRRATAEEHLQVSNLFRLTAERAVAAGDLALASEAYWGMVAHMLQAVAERHGLKHTTNLDFRTIKDWLIDKSGDATLDRLFFRTYQLHQNFYRIVMTIDDIEIRALQALALAAAARPFAQP